MGRGLLLWGVLAVLAAGCDDGTTTVVELDPDAIVASSRGKQDGFAIEAALGDSLELSVVAKAPGAEVRPENARAVVFEVPADTTFAVVMRGVDDEDFEPWLQLDSPQRLVGRSEWDQAIVLDALEADAAIVAHADEAGRYVAVAADLDLSVDATFQLDIVELDAPAPEVDLTKTDPATRAYLDEVRRRQAELSSMNTVHEDGNGYLATADDTPLIDRAKINAVNHARYEYFAALGDLHRTDPETLRPIIGALWAALADDAHRRR